MKLGVVSRIGEFSQEHWKAEFETFGVNGLGASHLELISNYPYLGPLTYTQQDVEKIRIYAKENDLNLTIHLLPNQRGISPEILSGMFSDEEKTKEFFELEKELNRKFNIGSLDERVREKTADEVKDALEMARQVDAKLITIHGGSFEDRGDYRRHLQAARTTLETLNPYFTDIKLCVENIPLIGHGGNEIHEMPQSSKDLLYLIDGLDNIGICLDIGHANCSRNVLEFYDATRNSGKLWDMHISDNNGNADDHSPIGQGNIPFREFFRKLSSDGYQGYCSIELDTWCEDGMEKSERISGLAYLRKLFDEH